MEIFTRLSLKSIQIARLCLCTSKNFSKILDNKDRNWRKTHLFLVDGASYHQANSTFNVLRNLHIPIMLLSPFSYDAAPIEKIFNALKSSDINPDLLPTAKRYFCLFWYTNVLYYNYSNFGNVVKIILKRLMQIPKSHRVLNFHHSLKHVYRYLHL